MPKSVGWLAFGLLFLFGNSLSAEVQKMREDKTLSPYFLVKSDEPATEQLPLEATEVIADVAGVIADVRVTQIYKNAGSKPIEAIYVFPASTRAAVYGMKMTIGERTIVAEIKEKRQARADYEQARARGQSASLLEQERPNVFQMNVANILPGDVIKVELSYTELLIPTDGQYEFMYPTVVGPRYSGSKQTDTGGQNWVRNPYLGEGEAPKSTLKLTVNLATGVPLQAAASATHKVNIVYDGPAAARVTLAESEQFGGNRDFILNYRLSGEHIETGVLLYRGETENFFLAMVQPPKRVVSEAIPRRDYLFIVDVSGSMYGFPLDISKKVLRELISNLRPSDTFNVMLFSGGSTVLAETSLAANETNVAKAIRLIDSQQGGGATELLPALKRALKLPRPEGLARTAVVVTDGYVTVEPEVFDLIREHLNELNVFAFGIGSGVNRHLIEGMAHVGQGEPFVITQPSEAPAQAARFREYIQSPVLTGIKARFNQFDAYLIEPPSIPDVFAQRPVLIYGKWRGEPRGEIVLTGTSGQGQFRTALALDGIKPLAANAALRYLWARERLRLLADYNELSMSQTRVQEITDLALKYNLLSQYTSFVAIDSEVRRKQGDSLTTVEQPLPLPEGVSELALDSNRVYAAPTGLAAPMPMPAVPVLGTEAEVYSSQPADSEATGQMKIIAPRKQVSADGAKDNEPGVMQEQKEAKPKRQGPSSRIGVQVSSGSLDAAAIRQVALTHTQGLEACLPSAQAAEVLLHFEVTNLGKVLNLRLASGSLGAAEADQRLLAEVGRWLFPPFAGAIPVQVQLTLRFDAAGKLLP